MYIHLEGLDLAGKSTVCRRLAARLGDPLIRRNSIADHNPTYPQIDAWRKQNLLDSRTLGWFYYAVLLTDLSQFRVPERPAIQDSTILLRSLAFHEAQQTDPRLVDSLREAIPQHPRFTATFLLKTSHAQRLARLSKRRPENLSPEDFLVRDQPDRFYRMEELLFTSAQRYFRATVIDTTALEDASASDAILDQILAVARAPANLAQETP